MKLIDEVTADKLRGGYYTADPVVSFCVRRVRSLMPGSRAPESWLEPSAGDGAFLRGLAKARDEKLIPAPHVSAVELSPGEAGKCAKLLRTLHLDGILSPQCFFSWSEDHASEIDAVVGNPPFVRYQFIQPNQRELFERQTGELGVELRGVSNLWIPFAIVSLSKLRVGGAFALVLPSEFVSTVSAGSFRNYLVQNFASLQVDFFPRDTFAELLQDVVVVSGRRAQNTATSRRVGFCEHQPGHEMRWKHTVPDDATSWTRYFLTEDEVAAFATATTLPDVHRLGDVARIEVSIVTGANRFFTIDDDTRSEFELDAWARPFLARTSDSPGLVFRKRDHTTARKGGSRSWILDFAEDRPAPTKRARVYLAQGEVDGLPDRYKCRIREPWYRVPHIKSGPLLLSKRAHLYHRLLLNRANVFTTDTIYRGDTRPEFSGRAPDLVAGFQNTLSLLSSELEGRTYGGGVLELIPSEIARLVVPVVDLAEHLGALDQLSREVDGQRDGSEAVRHEVDRRLAERIPGLAELLPILERARARLRDRRLRS